MEIQVMANVLDRNDQIAAEINARISSYGIFTVNLLGSPGSGKTSLLEQTIKALNKELRIAVIEGDLFTSKDADRIACYQVPVVQINTSGGCHLDASMVKGALDKLDLSALDLLIIENVGNLVCTAEFNVGEDAKATVLSVTEGEDKPLKYPLIFKQSRIVVLNKIDLLSYTGFNMEAAIEDLSCLNPQSVLVAASCRNGDGLEVWYDWLRGQVASKKGSKP